MKTVSIDIRERISTMGNLFVSEGLIKPYILAVDSNLINIHGKIWHKSSMNKGIVQHPSIDMDARWDIVTQRVEYDLI